MSGNSGCLSKPCATSMRKPSRVTPVQVRLLGQEEMAEILATRFVQGPGARTKVAHPIVGRPAIRSGIAEQVVVTLRAVWIGQRGLKPTVLIRCVVWDDVEDDLEIEFMGPSNERVDVIECAELWVNLAVRRNVVAVVVTGRAVKRRQPDDVDTKPFEIVEATGDALNITHAVARAVGKGADVDLVADGTVEPLLLTNGATRRNVRAHSRRVLGRRVPGRLRLSGQTVSVPPTNDVSPGRAIDRELLSLALPALGALIAEPLYVLADTAVVGNIGTAELGGLGLATQVIGTVLSISLFLAYGTTSAVSRLLGAGRERDAANQAVQGLWIAVGAGIAFAGVCFAFAPQLLRLLQADPDVEKFGVRYLRVSVFGFPAMLLVMAGVGYLRGLKDTRRPLYIAVGTAIGNLLLELFLVFRLGFGVGASALSTVVFQWVAAGFYLRWIGGAASEHGVHWRPDRAVIKTLGRDGLALFVRTSALRLSLIVSAAFAARTGQVELGAHEIATQLFYFLALALDAIAIAGQAMVGTLLGANNARRVGIVGRRLTLWGAGLGVVASAVVLALRPVLPDLFTNDAEVVAATMQILLVLSDRRGRHALPRRRHGGEHRVLSRHAGRGAPTRRLDRHRR